MFTSSHRPLPGWTKPELRYVDKINVEAEMKALKEGDGFETENPVPGRPTWCYLKRDGMVETRCSCCGRIVVISVEIAV